MSRILDIDPISGAWETVEYDDGADLVIHRRFQDVEPVIDENRYLQTTATGGFEWMTLAARIPEIFVVKWLHEDGVNVLNRENWPWLRRKLNDPDYRHFRAREFWV
jgi:hypothetical protein